MTKSHPPTPARSGHAAHLDPADALYDKLVRLQAYTQAHWREMLLVGAGLIVAGVVAIGLGQLREGKQQEAADALFAVGEAADDAARLEALANVVAEFAQTGAGLEAAFQGAQLAIERAEYETARELYRTVLAAQPDSALAPAALMGLGTVLEAEGDVAAATASYERVLNEYPESYVRPQAQAALARLAESAGRTDEALALYRVIVSDAADTAWGRYASDRIRELTGVDVAFPIPASLPASQPTRILPP